MTYILPKKFVPKIIDAGEERIRLSSHVLFIRAFMAGAILAVAAAFAITVSVQTGYPIIGTILFPVGFCMLYLMGYDLLTGVFVIAPLALMDSRTGVTLLGVLRIWLIAFTGNFLRAVLVAFMMAVVFTFGFSAEVDKVGNIIARIGE